MTSTTGNDIDQLDFEVTVPEFPNLTLADRCDACGAAAKTSAFVGADVSMLLFCGNHFRRHRAALDAKGYAYMLNEELRRDVLFELPAQRLTTV